MSLWNSDSSVRRTSPFAPVELPAIRYISPAVIEMPHWDPVDAASSMIRLRWSAM